MPVTEAFGTLADGTPVTAHTLTTGREGLRLTVIDLGATVTRLQVPDAAGGLVDVALGLATAGDYVSQDNPYLGATVGRFANRIADARFALDGTTYALAANEGPTCLHGGPDGFHARRWVVVDGADDSLELELVSPDGDQGFPGAVTAQVRYTVSADAVTIEHRAETDAPTVVSLTNHSYFNLAGAGTIDDHRLTVASDEFLPVDADSIPLGRPEPVQGTAFDLRGGALLAERMAGDHPQLRQARGFDHSYLPSGTGLRSVARLEHPASGRSLTVSSTQPALQVYTGQKLDGSVVDRWGRRLGPRSGIALECQAHPDAPNQPDFPSAALRPGETYRETTVWRFATG